MVCQCPCVVGVIRLRAVASFLTYVRVCLCVSRYLRLEFVPFFYFFSLLVTTTTTAANEIGSVGTKTEKKGNDDRGSADVASTTHTHFDFSLRGCVCVSLYVRGASVLSHTLPPPHLIRCVHPSRKKKTKPERQKTQQPR